MSHISTLPRQSEPPPRPARLNSAQLRELSQQWRQRVDEDPEKVERVAAALEWLAAQREAPQQQSAYAQASRPTLWQALARWRAWLWRASRPSGPHLAP